MLDRFYNLEMLVSIITFIDIIIKIHQLLLHLYMYSLVLLGICHVENPMFVLHG